MKFTFQEITHKLSEFWRSQGCVVHQGHDQEMGAGTFNPATFLRSLGPEPYHACYIEPCRRPTDGRYAQNPVRTQHYFQYQVIMKPSPKNILQLYLQSLAAIGIPLKKHDIRFDYDDWESPTLGAWGLGWQVLMDGLEVTQFTYFQQIGGLELKPVVCEITYGLERLAVYLQGKESFFDLQWNEDLTYGDIYHKSEVEWSHYNFEEANTSMWMKHFNDFEKESLSLMEKGYVLPAYDFVNKVSHAFNILDARGVISVSERAGYIARIRKLACTIAKKYITQREEMKHPLMRFTKKRPDKKKKISVPKTLKKNLDNKDFLLEIGSEELPPHFVEKGKESLRKKLLEFFQKEEIHFEKLEVFATPRRVVAYVTKLSSVVKRKVETRKGPPLAKAFCLETKVLTQIGEGFCRSTKNSIKSLNAVLQGKDPLFFVEKVKGVDYLFAKMITPQKHTVDLLVKELPEIIQAIEFPKKMRWEDKQICYGRPLRWIVALWDKYVVPFALEDIVSDRKTQVHRQLKNDATISLAHSKEYFTKMKKHYIMVDKQERRKKFLEQITKFEKKNKVKVLCSEKVLSYLVNFVEWPCLCEGDFAKDFLHLPKEVLISEMEEHQHYFAVKESRSDNLKNRFLFSSENKCSQWIKKGNQRVLGSRFTDGSFLYKKDLEQPLKHFNEKLKNIIYIEGAGTLFDKVERLTRGVEILFDKVLRGNKNHLLKAATFSKADLASEMVFEFPHLQGIMGHYYALAQKEDKEVAQAIKEGWMPRAEKDALPQTESGAILSIVDKLDHIIACFSLGLRSTSSSDPYGLRRQAIGVMRVILDQKFSFSLQEILQSLYKQFPKSLQNHKSLVEDICAFFLARMPGVFQEYGLESDEIHASISDRSDDIYDIFSRALSLHFCRKKCKTKFLKLYEVYKRAKGQLEGQKVYQISTELLQEDAEKKLFQKLQDIQQDFKTCLHKKDYEKAYYIISDIQPPLSQLFDEVKILADDPNLKNNRLALLQSVFALFANLIDFSKIREN